MSLWFLCCVLLFIGARGADWVSHQSWFLTPELSLPWLILGGIGLAIASNRQAFDHLAPKLRQRSPTQQTLAKPRQAQPLAAQNATVPVKPTATSHSTSISFKIAANQSRSEANSTRTQAR